MRRRGRDLARGEAGSAIVEFVLVIPVLLIVVLAALDFSRAVLAYSTIANASREGARYAVLHPDADRGEIEEAVRGFAGPLNRELLTVPRIQYSEDERQTFAEAQPPAQRRPRTVAVKVFVEYPWQATSAVAGLFAATGGSATLVTSSLMDTRR